ncbi:hypothetical protein [Pseudomonas fakonensis]|nr:hypothetical protein [Pseudomonas fakonensis]
MTACFSWLYELFQIVAEMALNPGADVLSGVGDRIPADARQRR